MVFENPYHTVNLFSLSSGQRLYISCKYFLTNLIERAPSPTADEMPVCAPDRTSPEAKIPGMQDSGRNGSLSNFHLAANDLCFISSFPVRIKPFSSLRISSPNQPVPGLAPI